MDYINTFTPLGLKALSLKRLRHLKNISRGHVRNSNKNKAISVKNYNLESYLRAIPV